MYPDWRSDAIRDSDYLPVNRWMACRPNSTSQKPAARPSESWGAEITISWYFLMDAPIPTSRATSGCSHECSSALERLQLSPLRKPSRPLQRSPEHLQSPQPLSSGEDPGVSTSGYSKSFRLRRSRGNALKAGSPPSPLNCAERHPGLRCVHPSTSAAETLRSEEGCRSLSRGVVRQEESGDRVSVDEQSCGGEMRVRLGKHALCQCRRRLYPLVAPRCPGEPQCQLYLAPSSCDPSEHGHDRARRDFSDKGDRLWVRATVLAIGSLPGLASQYDAQRVLPPREPRLAWVTHLRGHRCRSAPGQVRQSTELPSCRK